MYICTIIGCSILIREEGSIMIQYRLNDSIDTIKDTNTLKEWILSIHSKSTHMLANKPNKDDMLLLATHMHDMVSDTLIYIVQHNIRDNNHNDYIVYVQCINTLTDIAENIKDECTL